MICDLILEYIRIRLNNSFSNFALKFYFEDFTYKESNLNLEFLSFIVKIVVVLFYVLCLVFKME